MIDTEMKIVTTKMLRKIVNRSEKARLSRLPNDLLWEQIDQTGRHVLNPMPTSIGEQFVRTFAMCKISGQSEPVELFIDVTNEDWEQLVKEEHE